MLVLSPNVSPYPCVTNNFVTNMLCGFHTDTQDQILRSCAFYAVFSLKVGVNLHHEGPGCLNLRGSGEHTHFWRQGEEGAHDKTAGGHYHGDTSPEEVRPDKQNTLYEQDCFQVSYEGYFNLPLRWSGCGMQWSRKWRIEKNTKCKNKTDLFSK